MELELIFNIGEDKKVLFIRLRDYETTRLRD